jgi:ubiquinone/menaquinone biosynthesis C-methylase UbiE
MKHTIPTILLTTALALACGCSQRTEQNAGDAGGESTAPAAGERSAADPSINKTFEDPNLDVSQFVERFEHEGREVYDQRERIAALVCPKPGMAVADIGAGTGIHTMLFSKNAGSDGKVYAVDIAPQFLEYIDKRAAEAGAKNIKTVLCKEDSVELPEDSIDVAFICDTYHHFEYPKSTMTSLFKAMRPGGIVYVIDFIREPGKSTDWVMNHVRAGQDTVTREIESVGFKLINDNAAEGWLTTNYMIALQKPH